MNERVVITFPDDRELFVFIITYYNDTGEVVKEETEETYEGALEVAKFIIE